MRPNETQREKERLVMNLAQRFDTAIGDLAVVEHVVLNFGRFVRKAKHEMIRPIVQRNTERFRLGREYSPRDLDASVHSTPELIDREIARLKLEAMRIDIDSLTEEQKKYLSSWEFGT